MTNFISKLRTEPLQLEGLHAAIKRLPLGHEMLPILESRYASRKAGFGGEQQLDKVFDKYSFPMQYRVLHDVSLTSSTPFQIDTLFITPTYAVIFEVKNISGELKIVSNPPQLIRVLNNGEVKGFNSPITQVENNCTLLQDWFLSRNISLPIYGAIVLAYSKQRVDLFDTKTPFLFPSAVPNFIRNLPIAPPLLDEETFSTLTNDLVYSHREYIPPPICLTYPEIKSSIKTGVSCPSCDFIGMQKYMKGWRCTACGKTSPDAHKQAIRDWFLLYGGQMSNQDCCTFLHIKRQSATRILRGMNLRQEGANRNRTYSMFME